MHVEKILCPVDFSPSSDRALETAIALARQFGAAIHLIHSFPVHADAFSAYGPALRDDVVQQYRASASDRLSRLRDEVASQGIATTARLSPVDPSLAIADEARAEEVDLIVMGTRGLTGLKHIALGSVAERTLRIAPCPVMTVGAGKIEGESRH
jgi:nucleotide-binding universal stress UspA family protein